ncbi:hypothetical protein PG997_000156 [Apiospora hydei]|uniref:Uncharacterized protein n=1 Tax=Apiospora hydei TaxID=1337664 RepID=A0ABR1X9S3_9PEZI
MFTRHRNAGNIEVVIVRVRPLELAADLERGDFVDGVLHVEVLDPRQHVEPVVDDEALDGPDPVGVVNAGEFTGFHDAAGLVGLELHNVQLADLVFGGNGGLLPVEATNPYITAPRYQSSTRVYSEWMECRSVWMVLKWTARWQKANPLCYVVVEGIRYGYEKENLGILHSR